MKKIIFFFCCYIAAMSVAQAQMIPEQHDTTYWRKIGETAMRNAPFVFKGRCLGTNTKRGKDTEYLVHPIVVTEVYRGSISVGDTIEIDYISGCYYDEKGHSVCPMHAGGPAADIHTEPWEEQYFFVKPVNLPKRHKYTKQVFEFFDIYYSAAHADFNPYLNKRIYRFYIEFENETAFLNSLVRNMKIKPTINETPKPIITPKTDSPKPQKNKKKAKRLGLNKVSSMPPFVLNVNAYISPTVENGRKNWSLGALTATEDSCYMRSITADFTYNSPYLPQNIANYIGTNIIAVLPTTLTATLTDGTQVPAYETTITNVPSNPNKIRVTTSLKYYENAVSYRKRFKHPGVMAMRLFTTHPNVLCLAPLGEISNVSATYDMNKNGWQANPSGAFVINYVTTQYRSETPNIACPAIDSIVFTPKNIRAGVGDILTIRAYQGGQPCTGYWGDMKGNIKLEMQMNPIVVVRQTMYLK